MKIPKFSSEAEEAAWWYDHRAEVEADIRRRMSDKPRLNLADVLSRAELSPAANDRLEDLAESVADHINERAARMTPAERARADAETRRIAARVRR